MQSQMSEEAKKFRNEILTKYPTEELKKWTEEEKVALNSFCEAFIKVLENTKTA